MKDRSGFRKLLSLLLLAVFIPGAVHAFDTGPHFDLTRSVLKERGFADASIKITQVENWLTDYYSSSPTLSGPKRAGFEKLHFDNLFNTKQVVNYWARLLENLKTRVHITAAENDPLKMLIVAGIGLHAVQDFYTHSNWVETHPRPVGGSYRTDTVLNSPYADLGLFTGKYPANRKSGPGAGVIPVGAQVHGGYNAGLNKDSSIRPRWDEAYVFAYVASHELIGLMERWSNEVAPGFWKRVQAYIPDEKDQAMLEYDIRALRNMSMWVKNKTENGHWKGDRSGSARFFTAFSGKWVGKNSSVFVKKAAEGTLQAALASDLYNDSFTSPLPKVERFLLRRQALILRTTHIAELKETSKLTKRLQSAGGTDFYSRITIGDQEYWERTMQASREAADPWFVIHFADQALTSIPINITVWDEDDPDENRDVQIDINPASGKKDLGFVFRLSDSSISGDVTGIFNSPVKIFTSEGAKPDTDRATFRAYITSFSIK